MSNFMDKSDYDKARFSQLPWLEKYRPVAMNGIMLPAELEAKIKNFIDEKNIPNMIFTGPPGSGKTSTIRCIARALYGKYMNYMVLELNASDDRGMKDMQEQMIAFCKARVVVKEEDKGKYATYKLIILDEADNLVDRSQPQVNEIMKQFESRARFAFTCNSSANIIEGIQSRCLILRYMRLETSLIIKKLKYIAEEEKIKYDENALVHLADISRGDMRSAINILQLVHNNRERIQIDYIDQLCDFPHHITLNKMINAVINNDLYLAFSIIASLKNNGYTGSDIMLGLMSTLKSDLCAGIPEKTKVTIFEQVCITTYRISKGVDSQLQLYSCIVDIFNAVNPVQK